MHGKNTSIAIVCTCMSTDIKAKGICFTYPLYVILNCQAELKPSAYALSRSAAFHVNADFPPVKL